MTAPSGGPSLALDYLKTTLANSAAFQTLVGAEDATEAKASIYLHSLPVPADANQYTLAELTGYRPYALLWTTRYEGAHEASDSAHRFRENGAMSMQIEQDVASAITTNNAEVELRWENTIGNIIGELFDLAGQAGYLAITRISANDGLHRTHPDQYATLGDSQWADLEVEWGT